MYFRVILAIMNAKQHEKTIMDTKQHKNDTTLNNTKKFVCFRVDGGLENFVWFSVN